jgi:hypothetical protein
MVDNDKQMANKGMEYKINSFGYGTDHDEKTLTMISGFKTGNFYYIKEVGLVAECFIDSLGYMMSYIAKQGEITIFLNGQCRIFKKYGPQWNKE